MKENNSVNLEEFSKLPLLDREGKEHTVASFWQEQPAVFVFVRQFG